MLKRAAAVAGILFFAVASIAQQAHAAWPDRPIHWIVGFGPGGANDLIARIAADATGRKRSATTVILTSILNSPLERSPQQRTSIATRFA